MWQHLVVLDCIVLFIVVKSFRVVGSTRKCSKKLKANGLLRSKHMLKLKMELYGAACVNLKEVLSGTDSHLCNSLFLVFRAVGI